MSLFGELNCHTVYTNAYACAATHLFVCLLYNKYLKIFLNKGPGLIFFLTLNSLQCLR
jgi:hypothetical protein